MELDNVCTTAVKSNDGNPLAIIISGDEARTAFLVLNIDGAALSVRFAPLHAGTSDKVSLNRQEGRNEEKESQGGGGGAGAGAGAGVVFGCKAGVGSFITHLHGKVCCAPRAFQLIFICGVNHHLFSDFAAAGLLQIHAPQLAITPRNLLDVLQTPNGKQTQTN